MKKLFMAVIAFMMTLSASAQFYIYYSDGTVAKVDSISMIAPEESEQPNPSAGIGVFSVSDSKQVTFSPGNLQYTQSTNTWSFAENQYDCLGEANIAIDADVLADKVDLFGWSTGATNFGVSTSEDNNDYSGSFVDWGTNQIGSDAPNTWRTLSYDEWYYLRYNRTNANDLVGVAQVNGVNGLILLPDNWTCPAGITFKSGFHSDWSVEAYGQYQTFTAEQWSKLEAAGAIFLPAAGGRGGTNVGSVQLRGFYWSATETEGGGANDLSFFSDEAYMGGFHRDTGRSVRLVKDVEGENIDPEQPGEGGEEPGEPNPGTPDTPEEPTTPSAGIGAFSVSATKQVTFSPGNLQYHPMNDEWRFAENQWSYIGEENSNISEDYNGWIDMFFWGRGDNPMNNSKDYDDFTEFIDWGVNRIGKDKENVWRTLSAAEWDYLLFTRNNADSLCFLTKVCEVNGLVLLPDNMNEDALAKSYAQLSNITLDQWMIIEKLGAIFLPASGKATGYIFMHDVGVGGYYWSSTKYVDFGAKCVWFDNSTLSVLYNYLYYQQSVRLVKDL